MSTLAIVMTIEEVMSDLNRQIRKRFPELRRVPFKSIGIEWPDYQPNRGDDVTRWGTYRVEIRGHLQHVPICELSTGEIESLA